jgi:5-formyltetrahydrofolate cyclo-ligase
MIEDGVDKKAMRALMKARLGEIRPEDMARRSGQVAERLAAMQQWSGADTLLCFLSMPHEIVTGPIIQAARAAGKAVAVPRIVGGDIRFLIMPLSTGKLPLDRWNIPVPDPLWPPLDPPGAGRILVACPGLAFDREGNRLGRGKGYYDRFLTRLWQEAREVFTVGVCLSEQLMPSLPHEDYDQRMDALVTENETVVFG